MSGLHHFFEGPADAPVLVMSNSLGTTLEMWEDQAPALAERFRLLRYDTRGHGRSPTPEGPWSMADLGGDVIDLLDRNGIERASFAGCSVGGMTGLWLGVNAPERIDRLALLSSSTHMPPRELWEERAATVRSEGMSSVVDATFERWFTPESRELRAEAVNRIREAFLETDPEGYACCCEAIAGHDMRAEVGRIAAPTLVVVGTDDPATPPDHARVISTQVKGARLIVLEQARHLLNVEHPERVNAELLAHLSA